MTKPLAERVAEVEAFNRSMTAEPHKFDAVAKAQMSAMMTGLLPDLIADWRRLEMERMIEHERGNCLAENIAMFKEDIAKLEQENARLQENAATSEKWRDLFKENARLRAALESIGGGPENADTGHPYECIARAALAPEPSTGLVACGYCDKLVPPGQLVGHLCADCVPYRAPEPSPELAPGVPGLADALLKVAERFPTEDVYDPADDDLCAEPSPDPRLLCYGRPEVSPVDEHGNCKVCGGSRLGAPHPECAEPSPEAASTDNCGKARHWPSPEKRSTCSARTEAARTSMPQDNDYALKKANRWLRAHLKEIEQNADRACRLLSYRDNGYPSLEQIRGCARAALEHEPEPSPEEEK